jgi:hypothetical protein
MTARVKPPLELAARALCRLRGVPEDTRFNGAPMWHSAAFEALTVLKAALSEDDLQRLVPDHLWPSLHDPKRKAEE